MNIPDWQELVAASDCGKDDAIPEGAKPVKEWAKVYNKSISQVERVLRKLAENGTWECFALNVTTSYGRRLVNHYRPKNSSC